MKSPFASSGTQHSVSITLCLNGAHLSTAYDVIAPAGATTDEFHRRVVRVVAEEHGWQWLEAATVSFSVEPAPAG